MAFNERISDHVHWTCADWIVVDSSALSTVAADTRTWVYTLCINACLVCWTVRAESTFRFAASSGWISEVSWQAFTHSVSSDVSANRIQSAWRWVAWVFVFNRFFLLDDSKALSEWISGKSAWAGTYGDVVGYCTKSFKATYSRAWILTSKFDTSLV